MKKAEITTKMVGMQRGEKYYNEILQVGKTKTTSIREEKCIFIGLSRVYSTSQMID